MDTHGAAVLNRPIEPAGPVSAYKTFGIAAPPATHWRPATCAEVDCPHYLHGWKTIVPADSDLSKLIRHSGRRFSYQSDGKLITYVFEAGQPCFRASQHLVRLDREEIFLARSGDWRADLGDRYVYERPDQWTDDFANHQDRIATAHQRG
jgi:hypothetical protein